MRPRVASAVAGPGGPRALRPAQTSRHAARTRRAQPAAGAQRGQRQGGQTPDISGGRRSVAR